MSQQHAEKLDRIAPSRRPLGQPVGYQRWTELTFVHWRMEAAAIRRLLPAELELDTWDGDAWVGLVPFHMSEVRPRGLCAVRGVSEFHETNVRTYVFHQGKPGVWFFSLDAANRLAAWIGRWKWNLNYFHAQMKLHASGSERHYRSRRWGGAPEARCEMTVNVDEPPAGTKLAGADDGSPALPGTLEHFLVERYYLYTMTRQHVLLRGQVHHSPYSLRQACLKRIDESLLAAAGIAANGPPSHVVYSPGVRVEVFSLTAVA